MEMMVNVPPSAGKPGVSPAAAARKALQEHWDGTIPVRPEYIAQAMGVRLVPLRLADYSGYYRAAAGLTVPTIEFNKNDPLVRQRFTVAHELGHFLLGHPDAPRDYPGNFGAGNADPRERAANQFAAELLMPGDVLEELVLGGRMSSVDELARAFVVSKVAMGYRMINLQLVA